MTQKLITYLIHVIWRRVRNNFTMESINARNKKPEGRRV